MCKNAKNVLMSITTDPVESVHSHCNTFRPTSTNHSLNNHSLKREQSSLGTTEI